VNGASGGHVTSGTRESLGTWDSSGGSVEADWALRQAIAVVSFRSSISRKVASPMDGKGLEGVGGRFVVISAVLGGAVVDVSCDSTEIDCASRLSRRLVNVALHRWYFFTVSFWEVFIVATRERCTGSG